MRDAFLRLERHGFVRIIPQVGTIVRSIDLKRARDICQLRMVLESFAARKAAEAIDDAQKRALYTRFTLLMQIQDDAAFREAIASVDMFLHDLVSVSYTHLDVYKRQPDAGRVAHLVAQIADLVHAVVGGRIDLEDIHRQFVVGQAAHFARAARLPIDGLLAVDGARQDLGRAGLSRSARTAEQVRIDVYKRQALPIPPSFDHTDGRPSTVDRRPYNRISAICYAQS